MRTESDTRKNGRRTAHRRRLSILTFLLGRVTFKGRAEDAPRLLTLSMTYGAPYGELLLTEDGGFTVTATYASAPSLAAIAREHGITLTEIRREGLLEALGFLFGRPGLLVGLLLSILLVGIASTRLWEIRVNGNVTVSRREVISELAAAGLSVGAHVPSIDVDSIENRLLMHSERISWISVNLIGTVAEIELREKLPAPVEETDDSPANLVARTDGVILSCEVLEGNLLVGVGDPVRRGEVLVSGVYDSAILGYRLTRARGAIYAETEHEITVSVPYRYEATARSMPVGKRCTLHFFGTERTLFEVGEGIEEGTAVEETRYLTVFGRTVPIGITRVTFYREATEERIYTKERAMELAYYRLSRELLSIEGFQGLLSKSVTPEIGEDAYVLVCRVKCIENIAQTKNIEVAPRQ